MADINSENVVIPDINELAETIPLVPTANPNSANDNSAGSAGIQIVQLQTPGDTNSAQPLTLPVGVFNVITSDQLQPLICVDNGLISGGSISEGLQPTHIFITPAPPQNEISSSGMGLWLEAAKKPVLSIRCKNTSAELHKRRLGSGSRGRCIKYKAKWYTPSEFETLCGLGSSRDWKHSIRFGGRSIKVLIDEGILVPHAINCSCGSCCDDHTAMGPIRLFTPWKRKRQAALNKVSNHLNVLTESLVQMTAELKKCVEEAKSVNDKQMRFERNRASRIIATNNGAQVAAEPLSLHNIEKSD